MNDNPKGLTITGWVLTVPLALLLAFSATMKFISPKELTDEFVGRLGYPEGIALSIGIVELGCLIIYLIPKTAVLGAILLTGYLGGAIATHVRVSDPFIPPLIVGIVVWFALFLRDPRLRTLIPLRRAAAA